MKRQLFFNHINYILFGLLFLHVDIKSLPCPASGPVANFCNLNVKTQLCVSGNAQINGNTLIGGNTQINGSLNVSGPINGTTQFNITNANFVYSYDTTDQTVQIADTFQPVTFNTDVLLNGWTHTAGGSQFTCQQTGIYLVQYHGVLDQTNELGVVGTIRATLAGNEVAGSALTIDIPASGDSVELSNVFLISATQGQQLVLQLTGSTLSVELFPDPSSVSDVTPSITLTIIRIA